MFAPLLSMEMSLLQLVYPPAHLPTGVYRTITGNVSSFVPLAPGLAQLTEYASTPLHSAIQIMPMITLVSVTQLQTVLSAHTQTMELGIVSPTALITHMATPLLEYAKHYVTTLILQTRG